MPIAAGVPYAALLLGPRLPGASGGYALHQSHLPEALRLHAQALEELVLSAGLPASADVVPPRVAEAG